MAASHKCLSAKNLMIATSLVFALMSLLPNAAALDTPEPAAGVGLPPEYGRVIYRRNPDRPLQVYIIGNSHRSSSTGENGANTVKAQAQTYRIGEWLINSRDVDLLLPEGFFGSKPAAPSAASGGDRNSSTSPLAHPDLIEALSDTTAFINADMLLRRYYGVHLQQVENPDLYGFVNQYLQQGMRKDRPLSASFGRELDYLQQLRSAVILQNAPEAVEQAYRQGSIGAPRAIMTIGMTHLDEIIRFLEQGRIEIPAPPGGRRGLPSFSAIPGLVEKDFGVTIILPRAIAENEDIMRLCRLAPALQEDR